MESASVPGPRSSVGAPAPAIPLNMPVDKAISKHGLDAVAQSIVDALPAETLAKLAALPPEQAKAILRDAVRCGSGNPARESSSPRLPIPASPCLPKLAGHCYSILSCLRNSAWQASAVVLNQHGGLNYRARISDLRRVFGIDIQADPPHPGPGDCATYHVPVQHRPRAEHLILHGSLENYRDAPRQTSLL